jgi:uncharacterized damage-inducible protein DinB
MENETGQTIGDAFFKSAIARFTEYKALGDKTFLQLSEQQLHVQPNNESNSIALIIQHLHGNMQSRWTAFLTEDGEKPWRNRDAEFEIKTQSKEELLRLWEEGWAVLLHALAALSEHDLLKKITIRSQPLTVVDAINRQLAHYSYHTGQVVFMGKWLLAERWQTLSIPKGGSQSFNDTLQQPGR